MARAPTTDKVDEHYYEVAGARSMAERLLVRARARIYQDFVACCRPGPQTSILDVGVSDVVNDGANLLERLHSHPQNITAAGLGPAPNFIKAYGVADYVQIEPNGRLPFADKTFDVAASNAVIEHVGGAENQRAFIAELRRVSRTVFLSAPNRWFPVEHHTAVPLMHYWRPAFSAACKALGKTYWLDPANLTLVGKDDLQRLAPQAQVGYTGVILGPFSSNLYMHFAA
jgi:hypothetical protein